MLYGFRFSKWRQVLVALMLPMAAFASAAQDKVAIASVVGSSSHLPLWIAQEQRLFQKHGVDASVDAAASPQARLGQAVPLGVFSIPAVLSAAARGRDLRVLMLLDLPRPSTVLVARRGLFSAEDLRGKRIGVSSIGSAPWANALLALDHFGLDAAESGISFVAVGSGAHALVEALESGAVDAAAMDGAHAAPLRAKGFTPLLDFATTGLPGVQTALVADAAWLRDNAATAAKVMAALLDGVAFALSPANEQRVKEVLGKHMNVATSPSAMETGYRSFLYRANRRPVPVLDAARRVQQVMARADARYGAVKLDTIVDAGIARKLDEGGDLQRPQPAFGTGR